MGYQLTTDTFAIGVSDVERWAEFSGDRNPVHFDPAAARAFGVPFPFVHGMLSIIPIKVLIDKEISPTPFTVDFRFARPLKVGATMSVSLSKSEPIAIEVTDAVGGAPLIYGAATRGTGPVGLNATETAVTFAGNKLATPLALTEICAGAEGLPAWVQLEAAVFSDFIHSGLLERAIAVHMSSVQDPNPRSAYTLLHTRNITSVTSPVAPLAELAATLRLAATAPSVARVKGGYVITFSLGAEAADQPVTLSKATLMLRLNKKG